MFYGLSAFLADLLIIAGPALILTAEMPRILGWFERRRLDPMLNPAVAQAAAAPAPPPRGPVTGLLDPEPTERLRVSEWLRGDASARPASERREDRVLVGAGATTRGGAGRDA